MESSLPVLLFAACGLALPIGLLTVASLIGPKRSGEVKQMPVREDVTLPIDEQLIVEFYSR